jgi:hypothetical protein
MLEPVSPALAVVRRIPSHIDDLGRIPPRLALTAVLLLGLAACGGEPATLELEEIRGATIPLLGQDPPLEVTLVEGEYVDEAERVRALLGENWIARGELDGDSTEDVAVVVYFDTGGSGNFREFLVLGPGSTRPQILGGILAGDRVRIEGFAIEAGELVVQMIDHADDDPMCCPTLRVRDRYRLRDGELVRVERRELERTEP